MSKRTRSMPPLTGLPHIWREIRYHEASRQIGSVLLVIASGVFGTPHPALYPVGVVLVVFGLAIRMWASGYIVKNTELATAGPYSLVRHPLYTGNIALLAGFALASSAWWSALGAAAIVFTFYPATISYEDGKMREKFGDAWQQWAPGVPAVVPRLKKPTRDPAAPPWSFRLSLRRNGEPVAALLMLYLLYLLGDRLGG